MMKKLLFTAFLFLVFPGIINAQTQISLGDLPKYIGESPLDEAGYSSSFIGDINGDGYDDFLIGAYGQDTGSAGSGAAYLIYGQATLISGSIDLSNAGAKFVGEAGDDLAGFSVSYSGDVNGDGYDDFLIGASNEDAVGESAGAAYLIYGQATQYSGTINLSAASAKFTGESAGDRAGFMVSYSGDVNGDGYADILISATNEDEGGNNAGAAYLIYGQATQYSGTINLSAASAKFIGETVNNMVSAVSYAGDVDGDGYADILIGTSNTEAAYLIYGQATQYSGSIDLADANVKITGETVGDRAGKNVSYAGDINGDGYDDFLISAIYEDEGANDAGAAYLIYGQATQYSGTIDLANASAKFIGEGSSDKAGTSISAAGDVNGDGYGDFLVGAPAVTTASEDEGAVYLIYGQEISYNGSINLSEADLKFIGESLDDATAFTMAYSGDVNGDGVNDVLIGSNGDDDGGDTAGAVYLGYIYVDADSDGVSGTDGLLDGTDCDDSDATVYENQTYYADSDEDDLGSEDTTSVCSSTAPDGYADNANDPDDTVAQNATYYNYDPTDKDLHDDAISDVEGLTNGRIKVTYKDNTSYNFTIYNVTNTKKTKAKQYRSKGYYIVSQPRGKKISIVNIYTGEVQDTITVASTKKYPINSLKIMELQNKYFAVLISRKKSDVRVYAAKILINTPKFGKDARLKITDSKVTPSKTTEYKNHKIRLKGSKGKVRHTLKMKYKSKTKKYNLIEI